MINHINIRELNNILHEIPENFYRIHFRPNGAGDEISVEYTDGRVDVCTIWPVGFKR